MKSSSDGFFVSVNLLGTDLEYLIEILIFGSLTFEQTSCKQCLPLLVTVMIWNHLQVFIYLRTKIYFVAPLMLSQVYTYIIIK